MKGQRLQALIPHSSASRRKPVFLQAAIGFLGDGAFDEIKVEKLIHPLIEFAGDAAVSECLG
jgi:hypothetical protein